VEGTTDVDSVAEAPAVESTTAVAAAEPIREPADALPAASLLEPNADKVPETALLGLLVGAVSLQATSHTACAGTDRPGNGVTTARCGPQAMERQPTVAPNEGVVEEAARHTPTLGLWLLLKHHKSFGSKHTPT
jgi:hypothetical protein